MFIGEDNVADSKNYRARKISPLGRISTIAGNGEPQITGTNMTGKFGMQNKLCVIQDLFLSTFINANAAHVLFRMSCFDHRILKSTLFSMSPKNTIRQQHSFLLRISMHKSFIVIVINWGIVCKLFRLLMVIGS